MADRNGWSFCSLVCEKKYAVFHPWKDKMFHFYTLIEVNCTFWEFNCSAKLPQKQNMRHLQRHSTTCNREVLTTFIAGDKSSRQSVIMHASQLCSRYSFGLPLIRMNRIHRNQFDHSHLDLLWSLRI